MDLACMLLADGNNMKCGIDDDADEDNDAAGRN